MKDSLSGCLRCRQNLKFGDFTSSLCRGPHTYLLKSVLHSTCSTILFPLLTNDIVLWRCHCRSRFRCLLLSLRSNTFASSFPLPNQARVFVLTLRRTGENAQGHGIKANTEKSFKIQYNKCLKSMLYLYVY